MAKHHSQARRGQWRGPAADGVGTYYEYTDSILMEPQLVIISKHSQWLQQGIWNQIQLR